MNMPNSKVYEELSLMSSVVSELGLSVLHLFSSYCFAHLMKKLYLLVISHLTYRMTPNIYH